MNLAVAFQPPMEISQAIVSGSFARNPHIDRIREHLEAHSSKLIVSTLLSGDCGSDGKVHSSWDHLEAFLGIAFDTLKLSKEQVCIQAILDGRDSPPRSAATSSRVTPRFSASCLIFWPAGTPRSASPGSSAAALPWIATMIKKRRS